MPRTTRLVSFFLALGIIWTIHLLLFSGESGTAPSPSPLVDHFGDATTQAGSKGMQSGNAEGLPLRTKRPPQGRHPLQAFVDNLEVKFPEVKLDQRGLFHVDSEQTRHPIELLMEKAKLQKEAQDERIARVLTPADAAAEYEAAYKMKPPFGFDKW